MSPTPSPPPPIISNVSRTNQDIHSFAGESIKFAIVKGRVRINLQKFKFTERERKISDQAEAIKRQTRVDPALYNNISTTNNHPEEEIDDKSRGPEFNT